MNSNKTNNNKEDKKIVIAEDYNGDLQSSLPPTFEVRTEYMPKKQTEHERQLRKQNKQPTTITIRK